MEAAIHCHHCGGLEHFKRDCPNKVDKSGSEAPGKSAPALSSSTATVGVESTHTTAVVIDPLPSMSDQQLARGHPLCSKEQIIPMCMLIL